MLAVAGVEEQLRRTDLLLSVEASLRGAVRARFGHRMRRRVAAELVRRQLPVEGRHVLGAGGIPLRREIGFAGALGGAPAPIGGTRLDVGAGDPGQDMGELVEGERRLLAIAQRDIPVEELGLGDRPRPSLVLLHEAVGGVGVAGGEQTARDDQPLVPPCRRTHRVVGVGEQQLSGRVVIVLLAPESRLLERQPRIRAQLGRDLRQHGIEVRRVANQREACLGHAAVIGRHQREHTAGRIDLAVPQQPVEPPLVVFRPQRVVKPRRALRLLGNAEIAFDPGGAQRRRAGLAVTPVDQDLGGARLAGAADRVMALQPVGRRVIALARHRLLGAAQQRLVQRPIRILLDKAGDLGKPAARVRARVVEPADDLLRQRIVALARPAHRPWASRRCGRH